MSSEKQESTFGLTREFESDATPEQNEMQSANETNNAEEEQDPKYDNDQEQD
jgi:hypothetical protein